MSEAPTPPRPRPRKVAAGKAAPAAKKASAAKKAAKKVAKSPAKKAAKKVAKSPAKKAAESPSKSPAKKAAPKKLGAARANSSASADPRQPRSEVSRETGTALPVEPVPPAEPDTVATPPPAPPPPPPPPPAPPAWGPPAWTPAPPGYAPVPSPGIDSLAITSMVLGIVAIPLFIFVVPAIVAVVLGLLARRNIRREPGKGGKGMATAGIVLGVLSILGVIAFVVGLALSDDGSDDSASYALLEPGNCYDMDFYDERDVEFRSCSDEHYREAFAVLDHPATPGTEYPGRESLRRYAERECTDRFAAYVGRAYEESRLAIVVVFPPRDAWEEEGLRRIVCAAARPDDGDLSRSVRDSGI